MSKAGHTDSGDGQAMAIAMVWQLQWVARHYLRPVLPGLAASVQGLLAAPDQAARQRFGGYAIAIGDVA